MTYEYKMIQLPQSLVLQRDTGTEFAAYLQKLTNDMASKGWEFYRMDTVTVHTQPGCLAALTGAKQTTTQYNIATYRQPLTAKS